MRRILNIFIGLTVTAVLMSGSAGAYTPLDKVVSRGSYFGLGNGDTIHLYYHGFKDLDHDSVVVVPRYAVHNNTIKRTIDTIQKYNFFPIMAMYASEKEKGGTWLKIMPVGSSFIDPPEGRISGVYQDSITHKPLLVYENIPDSVSRLFFNQDRSRDSLILVYKPYDRWALTYDLCGFCADIIHRPVNGPIDTGWGIAIYYETRPIKEDSVAAAFFKDI